MLLAPAYTMKLLGNEGDRPDHGDKREIQTGFNSSSDFFGKRGIEREEGARQSISTLYHHGGGGCLSPHGVEGDS